MQIQVKSAGTTQLGILPTLQNIIRTQGMRALYRGLLPPLLVDSPRRAIKFTAYEQFAHMYRHLFNQKTTTTGISVLAGATGGLVEAMIVVGPELVKVQLQDKANVGKYAGTGDAIRKIYAKEGVVAFTRGFEACIWRHSLWNVGYFASIKSARELLPTAETKKAQMMNGFVAGTIGGTVGTIINTPSDVVKSRVQSLPMDAKYGWVWSEVIKVGRAEGVGALYKGFVPKIVRLGPGGGILLVVFDLVSGLIRKYLM